ncbi:MAG: general secretion pathway protein GspB [Methylococcaceae bacterium]|jgi:general secretion pathway protein B
MSYILNALRKSERDRKAMQAETVTDRILLPPTSKKNPWTNRIVFGLICSNILIIFAFFLFYPHPSSTLAVSTNNPPNPVLNPAPTPSATLATETGPLSISGQIATHRPEPLPAQPAATEKPKVSATKNLAQPILTTTAAIATPPKPIPSTNTQPALTPVNSAQPEPAAITDNSNLKPAPIKDSIPFIDALAPDLRRSLPDIKINVFVYDSVASERFVMIDMAKYSIGQRTPSGLQVEDIRPDSLVLNFKGQRFQVNRP